MMYLLYTILELHCTPSVPNYYTFTTHHPCQITTQLLHTCTTHRPSQICFTYLLHTITTHHPSQITTQFLHTFTTHHPPQITTHLHIYYTHELHTLTTHDPYQITTHVLHTASLLPSTLSTPEFSLRARACCACARHDVLISVDRI